MLRRRYAVTRYFIFPPHLTSASAKQLTVCTRQDLGREHSILQYVTLTLAVYQVSLCQKCEVFFMGVKVNGKYCWHIFLLSQQNCYCRVVYNSSSARQCILYATQSNYCSAKLSTSFLLSYGPITVPCLTPLWDLESHIAAWARVTNNESE